MKIFAPLYTRVLRWAQHRHADYYLGAVSFVESWIFPIPTAVMLAPMVLANRARAWRLAWLATLTSVAGGVFGYYIGVLFYEQLGQPIIAFYDAGDKFATMQNWFGEYGVWVVLLAGVTPIPYKVFTIASGVFGLAVLPFILASIVGRAVQFFLVAGLLWWGGAALQRVIEKWMEAIGWAVIALAVGGYFLLR